MIFLMFLNPRPVNVPLDIFSEEIQFYELGESAITKFRWVVLQITITIIQAKIWRQKYWFFAQKIPTTPLPRLLMLQGRWRLHQGGGEGSADKWFAKVSPFSNVCICNFSHQDLCTFSMIQYEPNIHFSQ